VRRGQSSLVSVIFLSSAKRWDPYHLGIGRVAWQKRVRRLFRSLAISHATYVAIWEECYFRWCALTELVINAPSDPMTAESMQDSTVPVGDKSMTFEVCLISSLPVFTLTDT
jgi:hypothetical protein